MKKRQNVGGMVFFVVGIAAVGCVGCAESAASENTAEDSASLISGETYESQGNEACFYNAQRLGSPTLCLTVFSTETPHIWGMHVCKYDPIPLEEPGTVSFLPSPFINEYRWQLKNLPSLSLTNDTIINKGGDQCSDVQLVDLRKLTCNVDSLLQAEVHSPYTCNEEGCTYYTGALRVRRNCFSYSSTAG